MGKNIIIFYFVTVEMFIFNQILLIMIKGSINFFLEDKKIKDCRYNSEWIIKNIW